MPSEAAHCPRAAPGLQDIRDHKAESDAAEPGALFFPQSHRGSQTLSAGAAADVESCTKQRIDLHQTRRTMKRLGFIKTER